MDLAVYAESSSSSILDQLGFNTAFILCSMLCIALHWTDNNWSPLQPCCATAQPVIFISRGTRVHGTTASMMQLLIASLWSHWRDVVSGSDLRGWVLVLHGRWIGGNLQDIPILLLLLLRLLRLLAGHGPSPGSLSVRVRPATGTTRCHLFSHSVSHTRRQQYFDRHSKATD